MQQTHSPEQKRSPTSWLDQPLSRITINWEIVTFAVIVLLAVFTRFYDLGTRVMSHDESLHTYYSWRLYRGFGFEHSPLMHGTWQFITIALSYFMLGDSDFSARIPAVLTSIATVAFVWHYRRYLGRIGAIIAAALFVFSPFMLYYGRYVRNEAYVGLFGVITLWALLRYLDNGEARYLYYLSAATVMHYTAKETAFIYTAQALLFLGFLFVYRVTRTPWPNPDQKRAFLITLIIGFIFLGLAGGTFMLSRSTGPLSATEIATPVDPGQESPIEQAAALPGLPVYMGVSSLLAFAISTFFLLQGYSLMRIRQERSFDLIILQLTLVLPQLSPFLVRAFGGNPLDYSQNGMLRTAAVLVPFIIISVLTGLWWNRQLWLINAAIFYSIFTVFYTTIFTNGQGFFTGLVGSLGYWLEQQGVRRGSQPWYYYLFVQIPIYEYLPALGSLLALGIGIRKWMRRGANPALSTGFGGGTGIERESGFMGSIEAEPSPAWGQGESVAIPLIGFWTVTSLLAYTVAGEKMPWLTFHIALPMILLAGWALGRLIEGIDWKAFQTRRGWVSIALLLVFFPALAAVASSLLGATPPFQGSELVQLQATSNFLMAFIVAAASGWGVYALVRPWQARQFGRVVLLTFFGLLGVLTIRTSLTATYINYDNATEYLVYAHSAGPVKEVLAQAEEISRRTSGDLSMVVAYDDDVSWPFTWYLRNFENQRFYAANPTRDLRDVPVIIVGDNNFGKIEPIVGQAYYRFDYIRMWWPDQDYFNLTWDRILGDLADPKMRTALFNVWLNRDYTLYAELKGRDMSLAGWRPADLMRMYIRKDVAASLWNYGVAASPEELVADPYEGKGIPLAPDFSFGVSGGEPGQFNHPRGLAVAPDGSIYVADSENHRIQHLAPDGGVLHVWGSFADILQGEAPPGAFNKPWDVAVGPDGSVYVVDTWNHRIQKFTAGGEFIRMWGYSGRAEAPEAFWGPRGIIADENGFVYVTDTGNKRIVIFDEDGNFVSELGSVGFAPGQFDEPVGLALDPGTGRLFIADTWNQRMQIMTGNPGNPIVFTPFKNWEIAGWFGQSLDNKPYVAVDGGRLLVADPEGYRVLEFTIDGEFVRFWGDYSTGSAGVGLVSGVAFDPEGGVWVSEGGNNRLLHFTLP
ncbi:MAG: glycosyltransferase family 39 protein [Anaerolineales bacterium]